MKKDLIRYMEDHLPDIIQGMYEAEQSLVLHFGEDWENTEGYDNMILGLEKLEILQKKLEHIVYLETEG